MNEVHVLGGYPDRSPIGHGFPGVHDKVVDDLPDLSFVDLGTVEVFGEAVDTF